MDSEQYGCSHEKRRLAMIREKDEIEEEKKDLKNEFDQIGQCLKEIMDFFERQFEVMPNVVLDALVDKECELKNEQKRLKNGMMECTKEIADFVERMEMEKRFAVEDECNCVKDFESSS